MFSNKSFWAFLLLVAIIRNPEHGVQGNKPGIWSEVANMAGYLLHKCLTFSSQHSQNHSMEAVQDCLRRRSLMALERVANIEVIELSERVSLVKRENNTMTGLLRGNRKLEDLDASFNDAPADWKNEVLRRVRDIFGTHVLKIRMNGFDISQFQARHRKKGNMMGQLLMFGMIAAGLIVIPMGFQFLAVLGGKALLLAKLALLLTSIQGLKKIATSNMNYGLYSTGHGQSQGPCKDIYNDCGVDWDHGINGNDVVVQFDVEGQYDRQWPYEYEGYSSNNVYAAEHPEQPHTDLLHPSQNDLHPRQDVLQHLY